MIAGVVVLHIWALHVVGQNNPTGVEPKTEQGHSAVHALRDHQGRFGLAVFCILFAWFVFYIPNYLATPDNYIPANPAVTPPHIVPEWYYLPFYAILRAIPNKLLGVIALFGVDRASCLPALARHLAGALGALPADLSAVLLGLRRWSASASAGSARKPPDGDLRARRALLTVYYFAFFLIILPLLGLVEKPRPPPNSIAEPCSAKAPIGSVATATAQGSERHRPRASGSLPSPRRRRLAAARPRRRRPRMPPHAEVVVRGAVRQV